MNTYNWEELENGKWYEDPNLGPCRIFKVIFGGKKYIRLLFNQLGQSPIIQINTGEKIFKDVDNDDNLSDNEERMSDDSYIMNEKNKMKLKNFYKIDDTEELLPLGKTDLSEKERTDLYKKFNDLESNILRKGNNLDRKRSRSSSRSRSSNKKRGGQRKTHKKRKR